MRKKGIMGLLLLNLLWGVPEPSTTFAEMEHDESLPHHIPDFCDQPTIVSVRGGSWSNPETWSPKGPPIAGDEVEILHAVTYDLVSDAALRVLCVEKGGALLFKTDVNTRLKVGTFLVKEGATLEVGTPESPVAPNVKAEIVIADQPLDLGTVENPGKDPAGWGTSLIGLGTVTICGAVKDPTFVRLAREPRKGDTTLILTQAVTGWRIGDTVVLPDTRQRPLHRRMREVGFDTRSYLEELTIQSVSRATITLAAPLQFDHLGARDPNGSPTLLPSGEQLLPHVGNLTRNVIIRSENPQGTRGHTVFTHRARVGIRYALFKELGRISMDGPPDNTLFDENGNVTHIGQNQKGRYVLHCHHLMGPENPENTGYQFQLIGNAIVGYNKRGKWGITIHDSHFGLVKENVIYNGLGAGIATEQGNESFNEIRGNFVVRIAGVGSTVSSHGGVGGGDNAGDRVIAGEGSAFWFRGPHNFVSGNVAAEVRFSGYNYNFYYGGTVFTPNFRGADPTNPAQATLWQAKRNGPNQRFQSLPFLESADNEVYNATVGLWSTWPRGSASIGRYLGRNLFQDYVLWNIHHWGFYGYHQANHTLDRFIIRGDPRIASLNEGDSLQHRTSSGILFATSSYEQGGMVVTGADIRGMNIGIQMPSNSSAPLLPGGSSPIALVKEGTLENYVNIAEVTNIHSAEKRAIIDNVRFAPMALARTLKSLPGEPVNIWMNFGRFNSEGGSNTKPTRTSVYHYNGQPGDNFELFFKEQAPEVVVQQSCHPSSGAPEAGLTNRASWAKWGIANASRVAPSLLTRPGIIGYLSPIPSDISAPSISNIQVSSVTASSAVITWQTGEPSDSQVESYLTPDGCRTLTVVDPIRVTTHSVTVTGLSPGTGYRVQVRSKDAAGNLAVSREFRLATAP